MQIANCKLQIAIACVVALNGSSMTVAAPFSFDDIEFWVGDGANRAALVIDWVEDSTEPPALAWGFRWDGEANGSTMLLAIVAADPRLFVKLGGTSDYLSLYGVGYDANNDGEFAIRDGTQFDASGIAFGNAPFMGTTAEDIADYYSEGWTFAFWHYGNAASNPYEGGSWTDSGSGMVDRDLTDGTWDSWVFTTSFDFGAFAANPVAAPPPTSVPGDFNHDGQVDAADYAVWSSTFGSTTELAADANGNHVVDAADYIVWRANASASSAAVAQVSPLPVPEPTAATLSLVFLFGHFVVRFNQRK
jgi:hypothetical protein